MIDEENLHFGVGRPGLTVFWRGIYREKHPRKIADKNLHDPSGSGAADSTGFTALNNRRNNGRSDELLPRASNCNDFHTAVCISTIIRRLPAPLETA